jgi:hypothetical protein
MSSSVFDINLDALNIEIFRPHYTIEQKKKFSDMITDNQSEYDLSILNPYFVREIYENKNSEFNILNDSTPPGNISLKKEIEYCVNNYEDNFSSMNSVYDIPYYLVVIIGRGFHVLIVLICYGKAYTIGFGYSDLLESKKNNIPGIHIGSGGLYSPDYLLSLNNPKHVNKIVDIGILNKNHIYKINEYLSNVTQIKSSLYIENSYIKNKTNILTGNLGKYFTLSNNYFAQNNENNAYTNCASFVTSIFDNIRCDINIGVANPSWCTTSPPIKNDKVQKFITYYKNNDVNNMVRFLQSNNIYRYGGYYKFKNKFNKTKKMKMTKKMMKMKKKKNMRKTKRKI